MVQPPAATFWLFAAGFDWLEALLPFLFVAFWLVSQVFAAVRRLGNGPPRRGPGPLPRVEPRAAPRGMPAAGGGEAAEARAELDRQIADFLRGALEGKTQLPGAAEAAGGRPVSGRTAAPAAPRGAAVPAARPGGEPRPRRVADTPRRRDVPQPAAAARESAAAAPAESVAKHVETAFGRGLAHLHGGIEEQPAKDGVATAAGGPTQELVAALRNPATVRQMVLLREILDRPVERW